MKVKKKNLFLNSVHTRPVQGNSEKKPKKFEKLKKPFPALCLAKTGLDRPRKREKTISPRIPFTLDPGKNIPKKKKQKNSKN